MKIIDLKKGLTFYKVSKNSIFYNDLKRIFKFSSIPYFDPCCDVVGTNTQPVRVNPVTGGLETFNGTIWVRFAGGVGAATTGITAFATGGQTSATALTSGYNKITVVATTGDSVKLPAATISSVVTIKNNGATAVDVFPFVGNIINNGVVNTAIRIAPRSTTVFTAVDSTNWETDNQTIAVDNGTVVLPSVTFSTQPDMGLYKISPTQLGASVGGVLKGGFNTSGVFTDVVNEQTAAAGVTVSGALIKNSGISANLMFAGFFPTTAAQDLSGAGVVNVTSFLTRFTSTGVAVAITIASGTQIGQRKKISHVVDGGSGVLTGVFVGGTTITFTTVGEFADLIWNGVSWAVLELGNTATPGVFPTLA